MASYRITDQDLYRYSLIYDLPPFVKDAGLNQMLADEEQDASLFADPETRIYSTHTKAATWISAAHFLEHADVLPQGARELVAHRLQKAATHYGIAEFVAQLHEKHAAARQPVLEDLPDAYFGWLVKNAAGKVIERRLRLLNPAEIEKAAGWLLAHRDRFHFRDHEKIARRVVKRALAENVVLGAAGEELDKIAGFGDAPSSLIVQAILQRSVLLRPKQADIADSLQKLAAAIEENPTTLRAKEQREKLADLLDRIDRENGLQLVYKTAGVIRPEEAVFGLTAKTASDYLASQVILRGGKAFQREELEQLPLASLREKVGAELASSLSSDELTVDAEKAATVLPNLPAAQARLFEQAAVALGVKPHKL